MSKESLDNDDDSMTVWEGMPQAAMSPSSVASRGSKTLVGPADLVSPATQTLNMLSQNMDDLRYNMAATETSMMEHEPSTATTELNTPVIVDDNTNTNQPLSLPPPDPKSCIPLDEWKSYYQLHYDWIPVTFVASGTSLGMVIQRDQFFSAPPHRQTGLTHCKILRVLPGGVADGSGIHVDDWICRPISGAPILALFEEVQTWAKTKNFEVSVLRLKKYQPTIKAMNFSPTMHRMPSTKSITASSGKNFLKQKEQKQQNQQRPPINANRDLLPLKKRRKRETFSEKITDSPINTPSLAVLNSKSSPTKKLGQNTSTTVFEPDEILPFCRLCNHLKNYGERGQLRRRPRIHHAWCPQSSFFENNGGKDLLGRIQHGCKQLNCSACEKEFQLGKLQSPNTHSQLCLQNQERLNKIIQEKGRNEEREQTAKDEKDSRQRKQQQKKRALLVSPSSDEEDEEVSAYRPPRKKKQPETFPSAAAKKITKLKNQKDGKPEEKATLSTISTSQPLHRVTPTPVEALAKPVASALLQKIVDRAPKNQQSDSTTIKMRWESTRENPWGAQGHQDGDIVLYGPQHGLGHVETLIPSPRYCLYPFNPNSNYRTTHFTPEEGYSVLYLSRDPLGVNPWGFGVTRDEFGHACLVDHIQPFTPATGAVRFCNQRKAFSKH